MRAFRNSNRTLAYVCNAGDGTRLVVSPQVMHKMASKRRNRGRFSYSRCGRRVTVRDLVTGAIEVYQLAYVEITAV